MSDGTNHPAQDQSVRDQILLAVKEAAGGVADEVVEDSYQKLSEKMSELRDTIVTDIKSVTREKASAEHAFGTIAHALLRSKGNKQEAYERAAETLGEDLVSKTLNLQDATAGGILVEGDTMDRWFDVLRPAVSVLRLNPEEVPMPSRALQISGFTGDITSSYVGEPNTSEIQSEPTTGARQLQAKTQMTLVPISNQMIDAPPGARITRFIESAARRRTAIRQDIALLRGDGSQFTPRGLRNWAPAANIVNSGGNTAALVLADFGTAVNALESANVPMERFGFIWAPKIKNFMMFELLTTDNFPVFLNEMRGGTFLGWPFSTTTSQPVNIGTGSDRSEIVFADFAQVLYGNVGAVEVDYFDQASYTLNSTLVSAAERNEQVLVVKHEHDLNVEHEEGIYVIDEVDYGN
jgi:HK97 family phage major capsid protein